MILKLCMDIRLKFYNLYINDDPGLTVTYFGRGQIWSRMLLDRENCSKAFNVDVQVSQKVYVYL